VLAWSVAAIALVAVVALVAGQVYGARGTAQPDGAAGSTEAPVVRAPDISTMSPQERADRLFDRVMRYASEGKNDSAQVFAPMAIGAVEALAPLTLHHRYDLGLLGLATGDANLARAEADTILRAQPTHLLGLVLASRAAEARGDAASKAQFDKRLIAAEPGERAKALAEYGDHGADLQKALVAARGRTP
jgi:hypothetical protein